MIPSELMWSEW